MIISSGKKNTAEPEISPQEFADHFRSISDVPDTSDNLPDPDWTSTVHTHHGELKRDILVGEISDANIRMKTNKVCGIHQIRNEFLKSCSPKMLMFITELFILVLESGIVPTQWCIGIIVPLYKN